MYRPKNIKMDIGGPYQYDPTAKQFVHGFNVSANPIHLPIGEPNPMLAVLPGLQNHMQKNSILTKDNISDMVVDNSYGQRIGEYRNEQFVKDTPKPNPNNGWENYLTTRLGVTALGELSGRAERARQDQYFYNQQSTIGARDAVNYKDFQPNPYRLYSKYGGKICNYKKMAEGGAIGAAMDFLFEDDAPTPKDLPTAPSTAEVGVGETGQPVMEDTSQADLALQEAMYNPTTRATFAESAFQGEAVQAGQYGKQIIQDLTNTLGYTPQFNSVYRDAAKQQQLVNQGVGVPNSWHLTGDAVDMKPADWNKLSKTQQNQFRNKYDVVSHNNHIHMEPKGKRMEEGGEVDPGPKPKPVYVKSKNDPRYKSYQDSLNLYNAMQLQDKLMGNGTVFGLRDGQADTLNPSDWSSEKKELLRAARYGYNSYNEMLADPKLDKKHKDLVKHYRKMGIPDKNIGFHASPDLYDTRIKPIGSYNDGYALSPIFKKPVQPVLLEDPMQMAARTSNIPVQQIGVPIHIPNAIPVDIDTEQHPSNYSFTYRTPDGQQATQYFPDLETFNQFTNQNGYDKRTVTNNGKLAQATGSKRFKNGGKFRPKK